MTTSAEKGTVPEPAETLPAPGTREWAGLGPIEYTNPNEPEKQFIAKGIICTRASMNNADLLSVLPKSPLSDDEDENALARMLSSEDETIFIALGHLQEGKSTTPLGYIRRSKKHDGYQADVQIAPWVKNQDEVKASLVTALKEARSGYTV